VASSLALLPAMYCAFSMSRRVSGRPGCRAAIHEIRPDALISARSDLCGRAIAAPTAIAQRSSAGVAPGNFQSILSNPLCDKVRGASC
jgi:hypothetical protein